jgi:carbon-monoxide dehydrogenase large subunit
MPYNVPQDFERYAIGQSVKRTEDPRLLRGDGAYTDDLRDAIANDAGNEASAMNDADAPNLAGRCSEDVAAGVTAHGVIFRSPYAHGVIKTLDTAPALAMPGVLAVLTDADLQAEGIDDLPCALPLKNRDGSDMFKPARPSLARGRVRYHGEAVALVVAQSLAQAREAAEVIDFDVEILPAVTDVREALANGAPILHDEVAGNLALDWEFGDEKAVEAAFASAAHVTQLTLVSNRIVVNPLEPRAAVGAYDASTGRYTLTVPSQGAFGLRNTMAEKIMNVPRESLRILTPDVGGSFGMKSAPYPEYAPLLVAARRLGQPVRWCDERTESFVSDQHGRDSVAIASIALDSDGRLLAGRVECFANLGSYLSASGPSSHTRNIPRNFPGPYRLPVFYAHTHAAYTNTTPIGPYRGAGRPEGVYYMERLMDTAAREMGIDRVTIRQRNLIAPEQMPYAAVSELSYDSGEFPAMFEAGLAEADVDGFEQRRQESLTTGKLRGLGIACYLEVTGPPATEMGGIRFLPDGRVRMVAGSLNYGQGHEATFAQVVTTALGVPFDRLELLQGDSDELIAGAGTGGSRTVISTGSALMAAASVVIENGRQVAGHVLEAAVEDIDFEYGRLTIPGTDRGIGIMELSEQARLLNGGPDGALPTALDANISEDTPPSAFPNGCHVAEVEIDPATGVTALVRYSVVDDFGTLINPMLVEGQVHGGVAQGVGQALMERTAYNDEGQLISGSFMDYTMPRATDLPDMAFGSRPVPATTNVLGAKGCGEAGTTGSLPAVMNAVVDVLYRERQIDHIDMPVTSEKLWRVLHGR